MWTFPRDRVAAALYAGVTRSVYRIQNAARSCALELILQWHAGCAANCNCALGRGFGQLPMHGRSGRSFTPLEQIHDIAQIDRCTVF